MSMRYRRLGRSGLRVSTIALGTMTIGGTLRDAQAFPLLDQALEAGINLFDMSELADGLAENVRSSYGASEEAFGRWLKTRPRDRVLLATKACGPNDTFVLGRTNAVPHIRGGNTAIDRHQLQLAVDGSLRRLATDYIDLYQIHWPDLITPLDEQYVAMARLIEAGKVRYFGLSNDTPWGVMRFVGAAEKAGGPRPVSLQNHYNLLLREFEKGMQEICVREDVGLLAFSPLAMGVLSGKYTDGQAPSGARFEKFPRYWPRWGRPEQLTEAARYVALAREAGLDPAAFALAWVAHRPGVACVLSSVTGASQLATLIGSAEIDPPADLMTAADRIHAGRL